MPTPTARPRADEHAWIASSALALALAAAAGGRAWAETIDAPVRIDPENADFGARVDELVVKATGPAALAAPS
ncbi:MAG TPA: hypothetical protein VL460_09315 [Caulobacteraceae bacterium]|nr:hypothetical protein [Caulobacteraceae bacterium]